MLIFRKAFPTSITLSPIHIVFAVCIPHRCLTLLFLAPGRVYIRWIPLQSGDKGLFVSPTTLLLPQSPPVMPMHISPNIDTDLGRIETVSDLPSGFLVPPHRHHCQMFPRMGPIATPLSPTAQSDILGILQREQDRAMALLSSSPLLASLFVSYASQAAALESASTTPSPESEEWKALQGTIVTLQEEIKNLKSENLEMVEGLEGAEASQEAFRSQVSSLKEVNTTQQDDIKSLQAELAEVKEKYDGLLANSNAERTAFQIQVSNLEVRQESRLIDESVMFIDTSYV